MSRLTAMITILIAVLAGCGDSGEGPGEKLSKPTTSKAAALARIEQLIKETAGAIDPEPRLELYRPSLNDAPCDYGGDAEDRVVVRRMYYLKGIPKDRIAQASQQVQRYWRQQGHRIEGLSADGIDAVGRSQPDGYQLALNELGDGSLGLGVTSPCVWADEEPKAAPAS